MVQYARKTLVHFGRFTIDMLNFTIALVDEKLLL